MKFPRFSLLIVIFALLGYTHFLGGPYLFFRVIFWIGFLPFIINIFILIFVLLKTRNLKKKTIEYEQKQETIHVDAIIKE